MSEATDATAAPKVPAAEANGQLITALATIVALGALGLGMLVVAGITKDASQAWIGLAAIVGGLVNSLTAPSGISNVLRASKAGDGS